MKFFTIRTKSNQKYVEIKWKTKNTTMSEQFENPGTIYICYTHRHDLSLS